MAKKGKKINQNETPEIKEEKKDKKKNELSSSKKEDAQPSKDELSSSKNTSDSPNMSMENNQKEKTVEQKIHEDMANQKEKKNIFQRVWGAIKKFVKEVGNLVSAAAARLIYGKVAVQDLSKMEEMMMSPINHHEIPKENIEKEKETTEIEPEKQFEVKEVAKENKEIKDIDEKCQTYFDTVENKQPFQNLIKSLGFEYENNPNKTGVITIIMKNNEIEKTLKCDIELKNFVGTTINFENTYKILSKHNDIRTYDDNHMPKMDHIINPNELRVKTALLSAGLNQIMLGRKETSFEFNAFNQNLKMEITHTDTNDYAKIITGNGQEFEAFKPNGPEFFVYNPIEKIQESLENNMMMIEAEKAMAEMQEKEAEIAYKQTISYKIEQAEIPTNPEKNAWDDQFDRILNDENEEDIVIEDNEVIIEAPESLHSEPQYDDDEMSL